jgi:O-acetyl-ADP-ribose deacetylase
VVNAANSQLAGGGGVDGAIHRAGGPVLMQELHRRYPEGCRTGSAVITGGGTLYAKYVVHTVGPRYRGKPQDAETLASAYRTALTIASAHGVASIAFPSISTGAYGYPVSEAADIALAVIVEYLEEHDDITLVRMVLFDEQTHDAYVDALEEYGN